MNNLIDKDGVYRISLEFYHSQCCAGPSVSSHGLREIFQKSPAHFYTNSSINPDAPPREDTKAFILGRAAHHLLLGEENFNTHYIVRPEKLHGLKWHSNRLDCRSWMKQQAHEGRTVLLRDQILAIRGMAKTLEANPLVDGGILNGEVERSMIIKDQKTGVYIKSRPDCIPNDSGDFADLKTTTHFGEDLDRDIVKYRYDMQAALTGMVYRELFKRPMQSFNFVFVETSPPYGVEVVCLKSADIEAAEEDVRVAIDVFAHCVSTGEWFGPGGTQRDARWAHIPEWVRKNADYRRDVLKREIEPRAVRTAADYAGAG